MIMMKLQLLPLVMVLELEKYFIMWKENTHCIKERIEFKYMTKT